MTLNQLIYFQKVATLENYHQAAEILYVSQPSLSRSMAALETELGITLFKKDGRGVVLTKAGHLFLEHANKIIADCDVAVDKMHELSESEEISLDELCQYPIIGYDRNSRMGSHLRSLYKKYAVEPNIVVECPDEYSIAALVRENFGVALIAIELYTGKSTPVDYMKEKRASVRSIL